MEEITTLSSLSNSIYQAIQSDNPSVINDLLINRDRLIYTLINEKQEIVYHYNSKLFSLATNKTNYYDYKKKIEASINTIKKKSSQNNLKWSETQIKDIEFQVDSLQLNATGIITISNKNYHNKIYFEAIKLQKNWYITKLY